MPDLAQLTWPEKKIEISLLSPILVGIHSHNHIITDWEAPSLYAVVRLGVPPVRLMVMKDTMERSIKSKRPHFKSQGARVTENIYLGDMGSRQDMI